jgi:hypothetical protein
MDCMVSQFKKLPDQLSVNPEPVHRKLAVAAPTGVK